MNLHSKERLEVELGGSFILLLSLIYFFGDYKLPLALLISIPVHELGHMIVMELLGIHPFKISSDVSGFNIESQGQESFFKNISVSLAGPLFGLLHYVLFLHIWKLSHWEFFYFCSQVSLYINIYNLLPIMPLDGGRAIREIFIIFLGETRGRRSSFYTGLLLSLTLEITGIYLMFKGYGPALALGALWPLLWQLNSACKKCGFGIK